LKDKLAETKRQVIEHKRLAELHKAEADKLQALSTNIEETIRGLFGEDRLDAKVADELNEVSVNGTATFSRVTATSEEDKQKKVSDATHNLQDNINEEEFSYEDDASYDSRAVKDMKRQQYSDSSYIEAALQALSNSSGGKTIDQLIQDIFDTKSEVEFARAKSSFSVEIRRAVMEGKIKVDPQTSGKKLKRYVLPAQEKETTTMPLLRSDFESSFFDKNRNEVQDSYA
jgi:uncharacterized membrane-anchored protein YjiN (DUF445 family)